MKKIYLLLMAGLASFVLLSACSAQSSGQDQTSDKQREESSQTEKNIKVKDKVKDLAPDFSLQDLEGQTITLSELKGKKVYIKFWASWCSACLASLEGTNNLAAQAGDDLIVLSIVSPGQYGEKSASDFKDWFKELDYKELTVLLDDSGETMDAYEIRAYPTSVFINSQGELAKTHVGFLYEEEVKEILEDLE